MMRRAKTLVPAPFKSTFPPSNPWISHAHSARTHLPPSPPPGKNPSPPLRVVLGPPRFPRPGLHPARFAALPQGLRQAGRDRPPGRSGQERRLGLRHSFRVLNRARPLPPFRASLTHPWFPRQDLSGPPRPSVLGRWPPLECVSPNLLTGGTDRPYAPGARQSQRDDCRPHSPCPGKKQRPLPDPSLAAAGPGNPRAIPFTGADCPPPAGSLGRFRSHWAVSGSRPEPAPARPRSRRPTCSHL